MALMALPCLFHEWVCDIILLLLFCVDSMGFDWDDFDRCLAQIYCNDGMAVRLYYGAVWTVHFHKPTLTRFSFQFAQYTLRDEGIQRPSVPGKMAIEVNKFTTVGFGLAKKSEDIQFQHFSWIILCKKSSSIHNSYDLAECHCCQQCQPYEASVQSP